MLRNCMTYQNYPFIGFIVGSIDEGWIKENSEWILVHLAKTQDSYSAEILFKRFPKLGSFCLLPLLKEAVVNGEADFVNWIFLNGKQLPLEDFQTLFQEALKSYNLKLIQVFYD